MGWLVLIPFVHRRTEMAHPVPTKVFPKLSPETAMLFVFFGRTHPPPSVLPFLFLPMQNLSPKRIVKWHHKTIVSCQIYIQLHLESVNQASRCPTKLTIYNAAKLDTSYSTEVQGKFQCLKKCMTRSDWNVRIYVLVASFQMVEG